MRDPFQRSIRPCEVLRSLLGVWRASPKARNVEKNKVTSQKGLKYDFLSMPKMSGRPGCRIMEMNGGHSVPYLACAPCVPLFSTLFNRGGNRRGFRLPGASGDNFFGSAPKQQKAIRDD